MPILQEESEVQVKGPEKDKCEISCGDDIATTAEENLLSGDGKVTSTAPKTFENEDNTST